MPAPHQSRRTGWAVPPFPSFSKVLEATPPAWREDAACRDFPTDLFFPIGHGPRAQAQADKAKTICGQCPVQSDCLEYALATNAQFGVFGGLTEDERKRARRNLARQMRLNAVHAEGGHGLEASA